MNVIFFTHIRNLCGTLESLEALGYAEIKIEIFWVLCMTIVSLPVIT